MLLITLFGPQLEKESELELLFFSVSECCLFGPQLEKRECAGIFFFFFLSKWELQHLSFSVISSL